MTIIDCQVIVDEIGRKKFAGGKPIVIGGGELRGYVRPDGTEFKRWVPKSEAQDTDHDYVEFGAAIPNDALPPDEKMVVYEAPDPE